MDIETYMREAARFDNHRQDILLDGLVDGLAAECAELLDEAMRTGWNFSRDDLLSEAGDVQWELARIATCAWANVADLFAAEQIAQPDDDASLFVRAAQLVVEVGKVSGHMEKHRREVRPPVAHTVDNIRLAARTAWTHLAWVAECAGFTMDQVRQANIDKLTARYAERGLTVKEAS